MEVDNLLARCHVELPGFNTSVTAVAAGDVGMVFDVKGQLSQAGRQNAGNSPPKEQM